MAKFEIYRSQNSLYYFRLVANNGKLILSSEGYTSKLGCLQGIEAVRYYSRDYNNFVKKDDLFGNHRFYLRATNGQVLAISPEGYISSANRDSAIETVKELVLSPQTHIPH